MDKPRKCSNIMNLPGGKVRGKTGMNCARNVDKHELREVTKELYPPIAGREWHGDLDDFAAARFYEKIGVEDDNGCIEWLGGHTGQGYAAFVLDGKVRGAHVVAMIDAGIHPPEDEEHYEAHHTCENVWCVNPYHLEWLTDREHADIHRELRLNRERS